MPEKPTATSLKEDLLTVPNAMTLARGLSIPLLYKLIAKDPGKNWWKAGVVAATDKIDGWAASQEDKSETMQKLGFRRSNSGRLGDPIIDTAFGAAMIHAGMKAGAIPRALGKAGLAQKAVKSAVNAYGAAKGKEVHVSFTGKVGEALTVTGYGTRMGAEGIENPVTRAAARMGADAVAWTGIGLASVATIGYARDVGLLSIHRSELERGVEFASEVIVIGTPALARGFVSGWRAAGELNTTPQS